MKAYGLSTGTTKLGAIKIQQRKGLPVTLTAINVTGGPYAWFSYTVSGAERTDGVYELTLEISVDLTTFVLGNYEVVADFECDGEVTQRTFYIDWDGSVQTYSPLAVPDLIGWYSADAILGKDFTTLNQWINNKKGSTYGEATTPSLSSDHKKMLMLNQVNGLPAVHFDVQENGFLQSLDFTMSRAKTVFVVFKMDYLNGPDASGRSLIDLGYIEDSFSGSTWYKCHAEYHVGSYTFNSVQYNGPHLKVYNAIGSVNDYIPVPLAQPENWNLLSVRFGYSGGGLTTEAFLQGTLAGQIMVAGIDHNEFEIGRNLGGMIAEVIVFNRYLTNTERADAETYLMTKYAL